MNIVNCLNSFYFPVNKAAFNPKLNTDFIEWLAFNCLTCSKCLKSSIHVFLGFFYFFPLKRINEAIHMIYKMMVG